MAGRSTHNAAMKVTVVTPYHREPDALLERCIQSVKGQSYQHITHLLVADGHPKAIPIDSNIQHITLPSEHADAGATPRSIGAISAFSQGADAVAFLDADNTIQPWHVSMMCKQMQLSQAKVVSATRNICTLDGDVMYVDDIESTGDEFCDTNCMFIGRECLNLLSFWITEPAMRLWSDRIFWASILRSQLKRAHCAIPSVNYHTKWAWHYQHAGLEPPVDGVWIDFNADGSLKQTKHQRR